MSLTKHEFGRMLMAKLESSTDIVGLSRWAQQIYLDNSRGLEIELKAVLLDLGRMEDAPEFEYSAEKLVDMARTMMGAEK